VNELFGLPITTLAIVLGSLLAVAVVTVLVIGFTNCTMFKFGLRNIPRRGLQSVLVIVGLAISAWIVLIAVPLLVICVISWVYEYYRGNFAR
jgi:type III secretory pathway component EscU